jgi:hypothetical protein
VTPGGEAGGLVVRLAPHLVQVVDEVAAGAVGAEAHGMVGLAEVRLVLLVTRDRPQLLPAVSKLALLSVLAGSVLLEGSAQFRLVSARVGLCAAQ